MISPNWMHGSIKGRTKMAMTAMNAVMSSPTSTARSVAIARAALGLLEQLYESLSERGDQK